MIRYATATIALLITAATVGGAAAQAPSTDKPPTANSTSGMEGDTAKNAVSSPKASDAAGTVDVSPGVGAIEGADGSPPIPGGTRK
ncbi:hypothetical protein [Methylobacterium sp. GC_Met_2]|uniref:hypothetical protein n=1 Tax=Methylobacterium sp. GC_Met_2 TaxID=2937376 RepID=UPI00226B63FA|nr:hypothetical protein [Methylobacterium sp. GC_Met_2]